MNTLILALEERGLAVEVTEAIPCEEFESDAKPTTTRTLGCGEWIRFAIGERLRQHQLGVPAATTPPKLKGSDLELWHYWNRPRIALVPTGKLVLQIKEPDVGVRVSGQDDRHSIETRLNDFVKQLFAVAEAKKLARGEKRSTSKRVAVEMNASARTKRLGALPSFASASLLGKRRAQFERWSTSSEHRPP